MSRRYNGWETGGRQADGRAGANGRSDDAFAAPRRVHRVATSSPRPRTSRTPRRSDSSVQQLHRMRHADRQAARPAARRRSASGSRDFRWPRPSGTGSRRAKLVDLEVQHRAGHRRAGARSRSPRCRSTCPSPAAAGAGAPGMAREHGERRVLHPLGVLQVTGRVVGDVERQRRRPGAGPRSASSSDTSRTLAANAGGGLVAEQVAVVLEQRAAAGAVDHDVVRPVRERAHVLPRQRLRRGAVAGVLVQRAAAGLARDLDHPIAVGLQRAPGRVVHVAEERVHDAAAEEGDGGRGRQRAESGSGRQRGPLPRRPSPSSRVRSVLAVPPACPSRTPAARRRPAARAARSPGAAGQREQRAPEPLVPEDAEHQRGERRERPGARRAAPAPSRARGRSPPPTDTPARSPRSPGRRRGARTSAGSVGVDLAPLERAHEHDAPARTVGLVAGGEVGGAGGEAEAAVDAGVEGASSRADPAVRSRPRLTARRLRPPHSPRPPAPPAGTGRGRTCPGAGRRAGPRPRGTRRSGRARGAPATAPARASSGSPGPPRRGARRGGARPARRRSSGSCPAPAPAESRPSSRSCASRSMVVVHAVAQDAEPERDRAALTAAGHQTPERRRAVRRRAAARPGSPIGAEPAHVALHGGVGAEEPGGEHPVGLGRQGGREQLERRRARARRPSARGRRR